MAENNIGLSQNYQGGPASRPRQVFEMLVRKTQFMALAQIEAAKVAEAIPHLNSAETEQLQSMLAGEISDCSADVAELSKQVNREAALAGSVRAMDLKIDRETSQILQSQMLRQIESRGFSMAPSQLAADAIRLVYSGR